MAPNALHDAAEQEGVNLRWSLLDGDDRVVLLQQEQRHLRVEEEKRVSRAVQA